MQLELKFGTAEEGVQTPSDGARDRVGTLITEGSSHRTVLVLFTYGSSETRVMTPMVGITTSTIQNAHTYCIGF